MTNRRDHFDAGHDPEFAAQQRLLHEYRDWHHQNLPYDENSSDPEEQAKAQAYSDTLRNMYEGLRPEQVTDRHVAEMERDPQGTGPHKAAMGNAEAEYREYM
jgi:hypothetical protein